MHPQEYQKRRLRTLEAADYLNVSKSFLEKLRLTGRGPRYAKLGKIVTYTAEDLDAWANARMLLAAVRKRVNLALNAEFEAGADFGACLVGILPFRRADPLR
jgi:hypothetical protein